MGSEQQNNVNHKHIIHDFFRQPVSIDLKLVGLLIILSLVGIYDPLRIPLIRIIFSIPIVFFVPGYLLMLVFFPKKNDIEHIERFSVSIGLSIAIIPLIGLILDFTPWGIRLETIVTSIIGLIVLFAVLARFKQISLLSKVQYRFPFDEIPRLSKVKTDEGKLSLYNHILSIILVFTILIAIVITIYIIVIPKQGEQFTEFYILGETGEATDYPTSIILEKVYPLQIGIGNHEFRNVTYSVEIWATMMQARESSENPVITRMQQLDQFTVTLHDNETRNIPYNISLHESDYNRIEFLLFNENHSDGGVAGIERINASYRDLHLWVSVEDQTVK